MKHINAVYGQNAGFLNVELGVECNHCVVRY
jgi:hypothetical protein